MDLFLSSKAWELLPIYEQRMFQMKMPLHALCKGLLCGLLLCDFSAAAAGPTVSTLPATDVSAVFTDAAASLNAVVNPNGQQSDAWFEFGPTTVYGQTTLMTNLGNGSDNLSIRFDLSGLIAGQSYHYRCVASNIVGLVTGADEVFSAPLVSLNGANPLTNACNTAFVDPGASAITDVSAFARDCRRWKSQHDFVKQWTGPGMGLERLPCKPACHPI